MEFLTKSDSDERSRVMSLEARMATLEGMSSRLDWQLRRLRALMIAVLIAVGPGALREALSVATALAAQVQKWQ